MGRRKRKQYTMTCCIFLDTAEIDKPMPTLLNRKIKTVSPSTGKEPTMGTLNQNTQMDNIIEDWTRPIITGGINLPIRISMGVSGVTRSWSKVPFSRSLATDNPARTMTCVRASMAIRDGRNIQRVI